MRIIKRERFPNTHTNLGKCFTTCQEYILYIIQDDSPSTFASVFPGIMNLLKFWFMEFASLYSYIPGPF